MLREGGYQIGKSVKNLHEVYEFSVGLGNIMGRENIPDIKSSKRIGIEETKY